MDRVTLRKLAYKSTMNFGKYADYTVQQVLDQNPIDGRKYLIWVYYNSSNISFNDLILEKLGIKKENTIKKPGKLASKELFYFFIANTKYFGHSEISEINTLMGNQAMIKKTIRNNLKYQNIKYNTKSILQSKNHGR